MFIIFLLNNFLVLYHRFKAKRYFNCPLAMSASWNDFCRVFSLKAPSAESLSKLGEFNELTLMLKLATEKYLERTNEWETATSALQVQQVDRGK